MAKKKKNRLKKFLKGAALAGAAALGAKALMGKKGTGLTTGKFPFSPAAGGARYPMDSARAKRLLTSDAAYSDQSMPGNLSSDMGMRRRTRNMYSPNDFGLGPYDGAKKGGRAGKDFGKRGVGKAKRGFGRAMKKGRK